MAIKVATPPTIQGAPEDKIKQLVSYLWQLSENLNIALNNLDSSNFAVVPAEQGETGAARGQASIPNLSNNYNELRALITNTATYVRSTEQKLEKQLASNYEAVSQDFGTFTENITSNITETARGVVATYGYDAMIESLQDDAEIFSKYKINSEYYIRSGFIDVDDHGVPIVGIAIGENLQHVEVEIGGEIYTQLDKNQNCAFYTADKVSFWINGKEAAWFSNSKLYIRDVEITGNILISSKWSISTANGLSIKWVGG